MAEDPLPATPRARDDPDVSERDDPHGPHGWEDADDWFADDAPARPAPVGAADDWLTAAEPARAPRGLSLAELDRRVLAAVGGAAVVVLLLLLWLVGAFGGGTPRPAPTIATTTTAPATTSTPTPAALPAPTTTLAPGSKGVQVKRLQRALARLGYSPGHVDGSYGPATTAALKRFQQASKLQPDGVLGPKTLRALRAKLAAAG